jgi:opacity protein-like surface antigen
MYRKIKKPMHIEILCLTVLALYFGFMNSADASIADKIYLKAGIGTMKYSKFKSVPGSYSKKAPKGSALYRVAVGYRFNKSIRTDLTVQHSQTDYKVEDLKQSFYSTQVFLNAYYDIIWRKNFVPYLTVGLGVGNNKAGTFHASSPMTYTLKGGSKTNLIWSIGAGTKFNFNTNYAVDLEYRYVGLGKLNTKAGIVDGMAIAGAKQAVRGNQVIGSLIYNFD